LFLSFPWLQLFLLVFLLLEGMGKGPCDHSPEGKDVHSTVFWHSIFWTFCHISLHVFLHKK
jgi:hypothetical protein